MEKSLVGIIQGFIRTSEKDRRQCRDDPLGTQYYSGGKNALRMVLALLIGRDEAYRFVESVEKEE